MKHKLPTIANRLRRGRNFASAWFTDAPMYANMLQKDLQLSKTVWSFVTRSVRSMPKLTAKDLKIKADAALAAAATESKTVSLVTPAALQGVVTKDFPIFRVGRIFMQHLPYKSIASTFSYAAPSVGPQAKYGLFQAPRPPRPMDKPPPR